MIVDICVSVLIYSVLSFCFGFIISASIGIGIVRDQEIEIRKLKEEMKKYLNSSYEHPDP